MGSQQFQGKTVEEATKIALEDLNVNLEEIKIEVVSPGKSGILGLGGEPAIISVSYDDKSKPNFDIKDTMVQSIMRYNQLFTVKTDITIPGDFTIKAGDIIECSFPELSGSESEEVNSETKGKYMVASVCHRVTPDSSTTSLSLVRDSFGGK